MDFSGRYLIPASPDAVWAGLNDPEVLKACIPGCEQVEKKSPTEFVAAARIKIGPVNATFKGKVTLSELDPPHRCVIKGEGQGGVAGFAKADAEVLLTPEGEKTRLTYTAKAHVGGRLAQIGQRLIDGAAKQIADEFFGRFATALTSRTEAAPTTEEALQAETAMPATTEAAGRQRDGVAPEIWVIGLIAVVAILLLLFGVALP